MLSAFASRGLLKPGTLLKESDPLLVMSNKAASTPTTLKVMLCPWASAADIVATDRVPSGMDNAPGSVIVGAVLVGPALTGVLTALLPPPPPPPPPQATRLSVTSAMGVDLNRKSRHNVCHNSLTSAWVTQAVFCTLSNRASANK